METEGGHIYEAGGYAAVDASGSGAGPGPGDILLVLRERVWWLIATIFVVFAGTAIYTLKATPVYRATATVQVLRQEDRRMQFDDVVDQSVLNPEDLNSRVGERECYQAGGKTASGRGTAAIHDALRRGIFPQRAAHPGGNSSAQEDD